MLQPGCFAGLMAQFNKRFHGAEIEFKFIHALTPVIKTFIHGENTWKSIAPEIKLASGDKFSMDPDKYPIALSADLFEFHFTSEGLNETLKKLSV